MISVIDTGIGISKCHQDKLFKLFGFLEDDKQLNTNGIGLGLMISKLIVEKFDGNIMFVSEKDVGSKFTFTFKLKNEEESDNSSNKSGKKYN
jgi:signal transduction histidine kinase